MKTKNKSIKKGQRELIIATKDTYNPEKSIQYSWIFLLFSLLRQRDEPKAKTISIDASSKRKNEKLNKIMSDMSLDGEERNRKSGSNSRVMDKGEDLLDLMDQL